MADLHQLCKSALVSFSLGVKSILTVETQSLQTKNQKELCALCASSCLPRAGQAAVASGMDC
jgi:hypothetical protein